MYRKWFGKNSGLFETLERIKLKKIDGKTREVLTEADGVLSEIRAEYLHNTNGKKTATIPNLLGPTYFIHVTKKSENVLCCVGVIVNTVQSCAHSERYNTHAYVYMAECLCY